MADTQGSRCSRMSPALCRPQEDVTLRLCCNRSQRPKFQCLILDGGQTPGWYEAEALISLGAYTMPSTLDFQEIPTLPPHVSVQALSVQLRSLYHLCNSVI